MDIVQDSLALDLLPVLAKVSSAQPEVPWSNQSQPGFLPLRDFLYPRTYEIVNGTGILCSLSSSLGWEIMSWQDKRLYSQVCQASDRLTLGSHLPLATFH